jgi:hypothetical protein
METPMIRQMIFGYLYGLKLLNNSEVKTDDDDDDTIPMDDDFLENICKSYALVGRGEEGDRDKTEANF